jgi:hypothetical protein
MSRPPHPPRLYNSNYTWRRVQIMKLLVMPWRTYTFVNLLFQLMLMWIFVLFWYVEFVSEVCPHISVTLYTYICTCVCVCVCVRARARCTVVKEAKFASTALLTSMTHRNRLSCIIVCSCTCLYRTWCLPTPSMTEEEGRPAGGRVYTKHSFKQ